MGPPITPHFFKRNHYEFPAPVAPQLDVCGHIFALQELLTMAQVRQEVTLECAGNGRLFMDPLPPGTAWGWKGVSNAAWTGVPLAHLLQMAAPPAGTRELIFQGADGDYARSLPLSHALQPEVLVVHSMNDQPLPPEHGGPLRLLVPGLYAVASVKWLTQVRPTAEPFTGYYQAEDYQFKLIHGPSRPVGPVLPRALLVSPWEGQSVSGPVELNGWAWSSAPIEDVRLFVDGQAVTVRLVESRGPWAWRAFQSLVDLPRGDHQAYALARDSNGQEQPLHAPWNSQGYENNSATVVRFRVS
jgi:DMSO/TMAO reductase YedYZ molybdopterin-dependent catalytic subunit